MWLEIELEAKGAEVRVSGRGSRGERPPAHLFSPELGADALQSFAEDVAGAVSSGEPLPDRVVEVARALFEQVFKGELRDVVARMEEAADDEPVLVRLFIQDRALSAVPWEALCRPGTGEGFLGTSSRLLLARGVSSSDPWEPHEVKEAVRVLAIAPGSRQNALLILQNALAPSIAAGELKWLDPIVGPSISPRALYARLRSGPSPHIIHWLGHGGVDASGDPVLRVADGDGGEEVWITAEALAHELSASFDELRLIILEACEGARPAAFGSAAEILAKAGADAVVAHLWPVRADVARACSVEIYRSLANAERSQGDVGTSVAAARRTLLVQSAEAFSPVLYLRGSDPIIFNFEGRRVRPKADRSTGRMPPALHALIERPFSFVLGELDEDRAALQQELTQFMEENGDRPAAGTSLSALTQRCLLLFGQDMLYSLFQQALAAALPPPPPLVGALARLIPPGLHVTVLWRPYLERAIAEKQPRRTIYAIQPSLGGGGRPRVVKRAAGASVWKAEPMMPKRFDVDNDIIVLRLYGGYSAEARSIYSQPLLTEDDCIHGLLGAEGLRPPAWLEELLARPRIQPGLFLGLSILDLRSRMLLRWLYDQRPAPKDSLALLSPGSDPREPEIWSSGGGLPGAGRVTAIVHDPVTLAPLVDAFEAGAV
jgi:hypothetical protein